MPGFDFRLVESIQLVLKVEKGIHSASAKDVKSIHLRKGFDEGIRLALQRIVVGEVKTSFGGNDSGLKKLLVFGSWRSFARP